MRSGISLSYGSNGGDTIWPCRFTPASSSHSSPNRTPKDPACYSCHDRFDPLGVALENFDAIGRWREEINHSVSVNSRGKFRDGKVIDGVAGLRRYLQSREDELLEAFTTKLLSYALGRPVMPTDQPTLQAMQKALQAADYNPRAAIHVALTSPQFLTRRDGGAGS